MNAKPLIANEDPATVFKKDMLHWLQHFVEKPTPLLQGWAPCPYARQARLENKVKFIFAPNSDFMTQVLNTLHFFDDKRWDVIVIGTTSEFPLLEMQKQREDLRNEFRHKDLWPLFDHPLEKDEVNGVSFNNGKYCLAMIQRLSKLNEASEQLKKKGYYHSWSQEEYDQMTSTRKPQN